MAYRRHCPDFADTQYTPVCYAVPKNSRKNRSPLQAKQPLQRGPYQALIRLLHARADELGLSVRALAARLDKPRTTVHNTLRGQRRIDPLEFVDWCDALEFKDPMAVIRSVKRR